MLADQRVGIAQDGFVVDLSRHCPAGTAFPALWLASQDPSAVRQWASDAPRAALKDASLYSPIARPGKVVAAPVNYRAHVQEMLSSGQDHGHRQTEIKEAGLFLKASSSVVGPSQGIAQRFLSRRTDHEIELCCVIGKAANNVSAKDALSCVAGWCLGLDITVRGPEDRSFRKSMDSYCVLGPWMVTPDSFGDPADVDLLLTLNGEVRQQTNTGDMVLDVAGIIEYASTFYSLEPGDVIMTGTPQGVGPIRPGDILVASGTGLGEMRVAVRAAD